MATGLLKSKEIFGKSKVGKVGSLFGGGWEIPGVDIKEEDIKTSAEIFGPTETEEKEEVFITPEVSIPKLEDMKVQENNITAMGKSYADLGQSLDIDYKQYTELGKQLDEIEADMQEAPEDMMFSLNEKRNVLVNQHNELVDKLKTDTEKHKKLYTTLDSESKVFNANIGLYNKYVQTQAQEKAEPEYIPESDFKDNIDAFRLGWADLIHKGKQYFTAALPNLIYADVKLEDQKYYKTQGQPAGLSEKQVKKVNEVNKGKREEAKEIYLRAEERYDKWLVDHPEFVPRPEWSQGVIENVKKDPKILLDPAYWGYEAMQSASFMLSVMGTTLGVTATTGNPLLGMAAGVVVATPSQSQDVWEELVANGATEEQASKMAVPLGIAIASVEVLGDLPLLAAVSKPFKKLLFKGIKKEITKRTALSIAKSGAKTFFAVEGAEIMEENIQLGMQEAAVNVFRENVSLLEKIPETTVKTFMATAPWAIFGGSADVRSNINERLRQKIIDNNIKTALKEEVELPTEPEVKPIPEVKEGTPKAEPEITTIEPKPTEEKVKVEEKVTEPKTPKEEPKAPVVTGIKEKIIPKLKIIIDEKIPKTGIKIPEEIINIKNEIIPKVKKIINEEISKAKAKQPDIEFPTETILLKVEEIINKSINKVDVLAPEVPVIKKEILSKVEEVIVKEISKVEQASLFEEKPKIQKIDPIYINNKSEIEEGTMKLTPFALNNQTFYAVETKNAGWKSGYNYSISYPNDTGIQLTSPEGQKVSIPGDQKNRGAIINIFRDLIENKGYTFKEKTGKLASEEVLQELSAKSWQVKLSKEAVIPEKINKTEIMNWAGETFGIPLKSKATHKWKSAGTYYPKQQIIRMEKWGELSVLTHEIAHDIDAKIKSSIGNRWKIPNRAIVKELADLDYDQKQRRTSEGFAEYMRHRLTTGKAEALAPEFTKYFNEKILSKNPELKKNLETFKEKLDIWNKQGAENRIIEHIDWKGEHTKTRGILSKLRKFLEWANVRFNDEFYFPQKITAEIEKVIGKKLAPSKNPAIMMEYSKSKSGAIARTFVMDKAIDEAGNVAGDGLIDVLRPIPDKEMKQFIAYAVSKRAINLSGRGIESGFDIDDARFIVNKYKDKGWDETVKGLTNWSNHALDWLVRAGGLDKETTQLMRDLNPVYLPFKRAFIDEVNVIKGAAGYVDTGRGVKGIKGSGRPIINPLESMVSQMRELVAKAQKIRIAKLFIDLSEEQGIGGFITKVPAPMRATTFNANQIKSYLDEIAGGEKGITSNEEYNDFLTVFTQDFKFSGQENIVTIWKDGKQEFYEIHPDLYEAFKGVDPLKLGPITKIFAPFSRMLRLGATGLKLSFGLARNPFRDSGTYAVANKRIEATVFDPIKGYYKDITCKPGEATWRFKKLGGGLSGQIGLDRASVQNSYDEMLDLRLGAIGKVLHVVKHPVNTLADIVSITEMGPRSAEIEAEYKRYTSEKWRKSHPNWTEEDAFIQAFVDAQDVTVNFTKSGKWAKQINQVTAFFNVSIRGPEKAYRSFRERPIQTTVKGIVWLTIPAIMSWYRNKDKDWYKNLPPAYKYNNLFFEIGGNVYRLPIPFELGIIFMSAPQAALDTMKDKDSKSLEGLLDLAEAQIPNPMPSVFQPAYSIAKNKNYLGVPIESEGMQYLYPTERKRDYSTKLAIELSKGMDKIGIQLSPIQLDYMIDSYSGGFLRQFRITGEELSDLPVIGDLMLRDPHYPKRQLNEYFSDWEVLRQKKQSGIATRAEIRELNRIDGFYKTYKTISKNLAKAKKANNQKLVEKYSNLLRERLERYGYE